MNHGQMKGATNIRSYFHAPNHPQCTMEFAWLYAECQEPIRAIQTTAIYWQAHNTLPPNPSPSAKPTNPDNFEFPCFLLIPDHKITSAPIAPALRR